MGVIGAVERQPALPAAVRVDDVQPSGSVPSALENQLASVRGPGWIDVEKYLWRGRVCDRPRCAGIVNAASSAARARLRILGTIISRGMRADPPSPRG